MKRYLFFFWILLVFNHLFGQNYNSSGIYTGPTLSAPFVVDFSSTTTWVQPLPAGGLTSSLTQSGDVAFVNCILQNRTPTSGTTSQTLRTNNNTSIIYFPKFDKINQITFEGYVGSANQGFSIQRWTGSSWVTFITQNFPFPSWGSLTINIGIDSAVQLRYTQQSAGFISIRKVTISSSPIVISGQTFTSQFAISNLFDLTIQNCTFKDFTASPGVEINNCKNVVFKNCLVDNIISPISRGLAVRINNFTNVVIDSIIIRNHHSTSGHSSALNIDGANSQNITVKNSQIYDVDGGGIVTEGTSTVDVEPGKSTHDKPIPGVKILNNLIHDCGLAQDDSPLQNSPKHGLYVKAWDCLVEGNTVYNCFDGQCLSIRSTGVVRGNTCYNGRSGVFCYWAQKPAGPSNKLIVENNVFYQTQNIISSSDTRPLHTDIRVLGINPWQNSSGMKFDDFTVRFNTVVMYNGVQTLSTIPVVFLGDNYTNVKVYGNYIVDLRTVTNTPKYLSNIWASTITTSLAKNSSNYTASNLNGFVDGANFDFRLAGSSPAVDFANIETDFPTTDIENNKRVGGSLDAGAYNIAKWTGATNSNWSISTNWQNGSIPKSGAAIFIPTAAINYPLLDINRTIGDLNLQGGAKLAINGKTLTIDGAVSGLGAITASSTSNLMIGGGGALGTIYFDQTLSGASNQLNNFTINRNNSGSLNLGNALQIIGVLTPTAGTFNTNGFLTLKSISIANSAIVGKTIGSVIGNVTVERFIPKGYRAYRDIGAGVFNAGSVFSNWQEGGRYTNTGYGIFITGGTPFPSGTVNNVDNTTGFDRSINAVKSAYFYKSGTWSALTNTTTEQINPYLGYRLLIRGDRSFNIFTTPINPISTGIYPMVNATTLRAKGQLITGNVTFSVSGVQNSVTGSTYVNSSFGLNSTANGYSSVANPYVCPIDWKLVYDNGRLTNLQPSYYYLDPTFGSVGAYVSYNPVSNVSSMGALNRRFIQAGQAFFVQNAATGSPRLIITEAEKSDTATKMSVFGAVVNYSKIFIGLLKQNGTEYKQMDGAVSVFSTTFSNNYGVEDAVKIGNAFDNLAVSNSLAITHGFYNLSIDGRKPAINGDSILIYLNSLSDVTGYRLQFDATQYVGTGLSLYLYDKYLLSHTALGSGITDVDITLDTNNKATYQNRFAIVFKSIPLPIGAINLTIKSETSGVTLSWNDMEYHNAKYYIVESSQDGVSFKTVDSFQVSQSLKKEYQYFDTASFNGKIYYRIKSVQNDGSLLYSNIAFTAIKSERENSFSVYPNPSTSKSVQVVFKKATKGEYQMGVYDLNGRRISQRFIVHNGWSNVYPIGCNAANGLYVLVISKLNKGMEQKVYSAKIKVAR